MQVHERARKRTGKAAKEKEQAEAAAKLASASVWDRERFRPPPELSAAAATVSVAGAGARSKKRRAGAARRVLLDGSDEGEGGDEEDGSEEEMDVDDAAQPTCGGDAGSDAGGGSDGTSRKRRHAGLWARVSQCVALLRTCTLPAALRYDYTHSLIGSRTRRRPLMRPNSALAPRAQTQPPARRHRRRCPRRHPLRRWPVSCCCGLTTPSLTGASGTLS